MAIINSANKKVNDNIQISLFPKNKKYAKLKVYEVWNDKLGLPKT